MVGWRIKKDGRMQRRVKQSEGERERQRGREGGTRGRSCGLLVVGIVGSWRIKE